MYGSEQLTGRSRCRRTLGRDGYRVIQPATRLLGSHGGARREGLRGQGTPFVRCPVTVRRADSGWENAGDCHDINFRAIASRANTSRSRHGALEANGTDFRETERIMGPFRQVSAIALKAAARWSVRLAQIPTSDLGLSARVNAQCGVHSRAR